MHKKLIKEYKFVLSKLLNEEGVPNPPEPSVPAGGPVVPFMFSREGQGSLFLTPAQSEVGALLYQAQQAGQTPWWAFDETVQEELNKTWQELVIKYIGKNSSSEINWDAMSPYSVPASSLPIIDPLTGQPVVFPTLPNGQPAFIWQPIPNSNPPGVGLFDVQQNRFVKVWELFGFGRAFRDHMPGRNYPGSFPILPRQVSSGSQGQQYVYGPNLTQDQIRALLHNNPVEWNDIKIDLTDPTTFPPNFTFNHWLSLFSKQMETLFGRMSYVTVSGVQINTGTQGRNFEGVRMPEGYSGLQWNPASGTYVLPQHSSSPGTYIKFLERIFNLMGGNARFPEGRPAGLPDGFFNDHNGNPIPGVNDPFSYLNWFHEKGSPNGIYGIRPRPNGHNLGGYHIDAYRPVRPPRTPRGPRPGIPGQGGLFDNLPNLSPRP